MNHRESFLQSVFIEDTADLLLWNEDRDENEKKKFVMFLNLLQRYMRNANNRSLASTAPMHTSNTIKGDSESDEEESVLTAAPNEGLSSWIKRSRKPAKLGTTSDPESSATGSTYTRFSDLTKTTMQSTIMGNAYVNDFKYHKRAIAINRRRWNPKFTHETSTASSPIFPPSIANKRSQSHHVAHRWDDKMMLGIFRKDKWAVLRQFITSLSEPNAELCTSVFRSLHAHRLFGHYDTSSGSM